MRILGMEFGNKAEEVPLEQKKSSTHKMAFYNSYSAPVWTTRNKELMAISGYVKNPVVNRCVSIIASTAASIPLVLFDGDKEILEHPFLDVLKAPNPDQGTSDFIERLYTFLMVSGDAYVEPIELDGDIKEMYVLRSDRMTVYGSSRRGIEGWKYKVNEAEVRFPLISGRPYPIFHFKLPHPTDDHYGMSPLEPALYALDVHTEAMKYNKSLLQNMARPSGALVYKGEEGTESLSDEQFQRLKAEIEDLYMGPQNSGRPMVLDGGVDWKEMGMSPKDIDFVEGMRESARLIALAFGVPPMLLGIPGDNTYSNYQEANRAFIRELVIPLVRKISQTLTVRIQGYYKGLQVVPDTQNIPALIKEQEELIDRMNRSEFMRVDEKRRVVGLKPLGGELGEAIVVPAKRFTLEQVLEGENEKAPAEPPKPEKAPKKE